MSENKKKKFEQKAKAFFENPKNAKVAACYITADGSVFRAEHYAQDWKRTQKDKTIEVYSRNKAKADKPKNDEIDSSTDFSGADADTEATNERAELVKEYIELFDTRPHHLSGIARIKAEIEQKKAELEKESEVSEDDAAGDATGESEGSEDQSEKSDEADKK